jgi:hypothetical protein
LQFLLASVVVDRGRVPEAAAAVHVRVTPELGSVDDRVELPLHLAGGCVERPHYAERAAPVQSMALLVTPFGDGLAPKRSRRRPTTENDQRRVLAVLTFPEAYCVHR